MKSNLMSPTVPTIQPIIWLWIFLAGGLGSITRFALSRFINSIAAIFWLSPGFPWGTIAVNSLGCFAIGLLAGLFDNHATLLPSNLRFALITGFLGGFTTFSAFAYESFALYHEGLLNKAILNILFSVIVGVGLVFFGFHVGRLGVKTF